MTASLPVAAAVITVALVASRLLGESIGRRNAMRATADACTARRANDRIDWDGTDGDVDELVLHDVMVHIEQLNRGAWWIGIYRPTEGGSWHGEFTATDKGRIRFTGMPLPYEWRAPETPKRWALNRNGVTRTVLLTRRWAIKVCWGLSRSPVRGWLANRSEWRQRAREGVCRPILTLGHFVIVMPRADETGDDDDRENLLPNSGPWSDFDLDQGDQAKPSSWGRFGDRWLLVDFDRAWDADDRGLVGRIYYGRQERVARRWMGSTADAARSHEDALREILDRHKGIDDVLEFGFDEGQDGRSEACSDECTSYDQCPGHTRRVKTCSTCGGSTDDGMATSTVWPCSTARAAMEALGVDVPEPTMEVA